MIRFLLIALALVATLSTPAPANEYPALITGEWERSMFDGDLPYRIFGGRTIQAGKKYPMVIYLHGIHLRGKDNTKHLTGEAKSFSYPNNYKKRPCFIVAPQCPNWKTWRGATSKKLTALIKALRVNLPVDPDRIYLCGYSMGGYGTWHLLAKQPSLFAAAAPVSGGGDPESVDGFKHIPIWAFHGEKDPIVSAEKSREMVAALRKVSTTVRHTEFRGAGHLVTRQVFLDEKFHRWLFAQKRSAALVQRGEK
ncbi:MAG: putative peptidase [Verrucomicrobiales bacterium]|jgi:predicted peptidase